MTERERLEAEIAARQARLDALPPKPDLSEAVSVYWKAAYSGIPTNPNCVRAGLRAAYPALRKAYGHDKPAWPDAKTIRAMSQDSWNVATDVFLVGVEMARLIREWQEANNG